MTVPGYTVRSNGKRVSVGGVVIWYLIAGKSAEAKLDLMKVWLTRNNAVVMAVLLLVLGVSQVGKGIGGL